MKIVGVIMAISITLWVYWETCWKMRGWKIEDDRPQSVDLSFKFTPAGLNDKQICRLLREFEPETLPGRYACPPQLWSDRLNSYVQKMGLPWRCRVEGGQLVRYELISEAVHDEPAGYGITRQLMRRLRTRFVKA